MSRDTVQNTKADGFPITLPSSSSSSLLMSVTVVFIVPYLLSHQYCRTVYRKANCCAFLVTLFSISANVLSFCLKIARYNVSLMTALFKSSQLHNTPKVTRFNYTNK